MANKYLSNEELSQAVDSCLEPTNCNYCPLQGVPDCMDIMFKLLGERLHAQHLVYRLRMEK